MSSLSSSSSPSRMRSKRLSISKSSVRSRSLLSLTSERSNATLRPIPEMTRHVTRRPHDDLGKNASVVKFVYSEAVERGFRRKYRCPDFGMFSAFARSDPFIEVVGLPRIYEDFMCVKTAAEHNKLYITKLREELGDRYDELEKVEVGTKKPKVSLRNAAAIAKMRPRFRRGSVTKLPPILPPLKPGADVIDRVRQDSDVIERVKPDNDVIDGACSRSPGVALTPDPGASNSRRSSFMSDDVIIEVARSRAGTYVTESVMSSPQESSRMTSRTPGADEKVL